MLLQLLFFVTPIFYELSFIPEKYRSLLNLNPMVHLLNAYRAILINGEWPDSLSLVVLALGSTLLLAIGYRVFVRASYHFVEEL